MLSMRNFGHGMDLEILKQSVRNALYRVDIAAFLCISLAVIFIVRRHTVARLVGRLIEGKTNIVTQSTSRRVHKPASPRVPGTWEPSEYRMPLPPPYPAWSIESTKPLPYRPFRYGPTYFVTMGLRNLNTNNWIELDNDYPQFYHEKRRRIQDRGLKSCQTTPEAYPMAVELLEELAAYLTARYPTLYKRTTLGVKNLWSGEEIDTTSRPLPEDPMQSCGKLTQDDLAIMVERPDGRYYLLAGAILLAGFWRLEDKLGMQLSMIHTSGNVPHYEEKLEKGMDNLFRRLKPGEMVARNNYVMQIDGDLPWATSSVGSEDNDERGWHYADDDPSIERHFLRVERQSLHRLPVTGGVVFTIRTYLLPITKIAQEDYVPGRLASAVRSWTDNASKYKGKHKYEAVLLKYLDEQHDNQVRTGLFVEGEDEKRKYPW